MCNVKPRRTPGNKKRGRVAREPVPPSHVLLIVRRIPAAFPPARAFPVRDNSRSYAANERRR
ncbi:hypothetical protein A3D72_02850 [Candidatus Uhrbacteria bacterium RIFCSPHIGHO2_02_FULL_57_19]|uniref:Uncharacterized protein n=1 Tax=Candidatus Uhrbacteria bacterium RIFCSPHIGHO2_02_FULL_57_19 TaxID=1802391 RepID=A0A1F7U5I9_9BACT|nr:MAG: hypothetical protein A3D72_02850 [Candidatus Uhrbacteria bacterium RIFCSPHIGHO2_02_FULL_57_19]